MLARKNTAPRTLPVARQKEIRFQIKNRLYSD